MNNKAYTILIDIGSYTVKVYKYQNKNLKHLENLTIDFKDNFNAEVGIYPEKLEQLYSYINKIQKQNPNIQLKIFATAVFRKLSDVLKIKLIDNFYLTTGNNLNIISHDLENYYLEMALAEKCPKEKQILLINIGGGSTELVIIKDLTVMDRYNIEIGVGTINQQFPKINNEYSNVSVDAIVDHIYDSLPNLSFNAEIAIYSGGELNYMELTGYSLSKNKLFNDSDHPKMITIDNFRSDNQRVFSKIKMSHLKSLMSENPTWMEGARGCSALAQAICQKYGIKLIVPSNADLIHGVVRKEFRRVTLSGSFRKHLDYIVNIKRILEQESIEVLSPHFTIPKNPNEEFVTFIGEDGLSPLELERKHLDSINQSDALIVCNPEGYVGASALIEIGYAHALHKRIIYTEKPNEFMLVTLPGEIGL